MESKQRGVASRHLPAGAVGHLELLPHLFPRASPRDPPHHLLGPAAPPGAGERQGGGAAPGIVVAAAVVFRLVVVVVIVVVAPTAARVSAVIIVVVATTAPPSSRRRRRGGGSLLLVDLGHVRVGVGHAGDLAGGVPAAGGARVDGQHGAPALLALGPRELEELLQRHLLMGCVCMCCYQRVYY